MPAPPNPSLLSSPPAGPPGGAVGSSPVPPSQERAAQGGSGALGLTRPHPAPTPHPPFCIVSLPPRRGLRHQADGRADQTHHHHRGGGRQGDGEDPEHLQEHGDQLQAGRGVRRDHSRRQARQGEGCALPPARGAPSLPPFFFPCWSRSPQGPALAPVCSGVFAEGDAAIGTRSCQDGWRCCKRDSGAPVGLVGCRTPS